MTLLCKNKVLSQGKTFLLIFKKVTIAACNLKLLVKRSDFLQ